MDNVFSIRLATEADRDELAELEYATLQKRYQGYLPEKNLSKMDRGYASRQVHEWLQNKSCQVGILTSGNGLMGYIACSPDPEMQDWGLILEAGTAPSVPSAEIKKMLHWAENMLKTKGCRHTHIWLLQDNLRGRFMVESFGFKPQKEMKLVQKADYTMTMRHYVLPDHT